MLDAERIEECDALECSLQATHVVLGDRRTIKGCKGHAELLYTTVKSIDKTKTTLIVALYLAKKE